MNITTALSRLIFISPPARALLLGAACLWVAPSAQAAAQYYAELEADELTVGPSGGGALTVNGTAEITGTLDVGDDVDVTGVVEANTLSSLYGITFDGGNTTLAMSGNTVQFTTTSSLGNWTWRRSNGSATQMTLAVNGTLTLTDASTGKTLVLNPNGAALANITGGTAGAPAINFAGSSSDTGIFSSNTDTLQFSTGGVERMSITGVGNVGIGAYPSKNFTVLGSMLFMTPDGTAAIAINGGNPGEVWIHSLQLPGGINGMGNAKLGNLNPGHDGNPTLRGASTTTGIYFPTLEVAIATEGVKRLGVTSSGVTVGLTTANIPMVVNGNLTVTGASTHSSNATFGANSTVTFSGPVSASNTTTFSGNTTFSGATTTSFGENTTLNISGTTSFSGNNTVTGNSTTTFTGNTTLNLDGTVNFGADAEVRFNKVYGDISMGDFGEE